MRFLDAINLPYNTDSPMSVKLHDRINKGFIWFIENMKTESMSENDSPNKETLNEMCVFTMMINNCINTLK